MLRRGGALTLLVLACGCVRPAPDVTDARLTGLAAPSVSGSNWEIGATIDPGAYTVTAVHLNWGYRPSLDHRAFFGGKEVDAAFLDGNPPFRSRNRVRLWAGNSKLPAGTVVDWNVEVWYTRPGEDYVQKVWTRHASAKLELPQR